ncbi:MAG: beta-lactamase family protein [Anaerolineaceae bacterium]|nr:beta-lactamase family protein [Anaerolineaceae bacterium]
MSTLQKHYENLDNWIEAKMALSDTPGTVIAFTDRETDLQISTYGYKNIETQSPIQADTLFEIGSIGKTFTAIAILQAMEKELLDIYDPVTKYLPWFKVQSEFSPFNLYHLLTHTSGLVRGTDFSPDARIIVWRLRDTQTGFPPGERYYYSDIGYKILGLVLQRVYEKPYAEIIRDNILEPIGMQNTFAVISHSIYEQLARGSQYLFDDRPPHSSNPLIPAAWLETDSGDGSIASTAADMTCFIRMILNRGQGVISEESFDLMTTPASQRIYGRWGQYGCGILTHEEDGAVFIGHTGDMPGFEAYFKADMTHGYGMMVMTTQPYPTGLIWGVLDAFKASYLNLEIALLPLPPDPLLIPNANEYVGVYQADQREMTIKAIGPNLFLIMDGQEIQLEQYDEDCFYIPQEEFNRYLLEFQRDQAGQVAEAFYGCEQFFHTKYGSKKSYSFPDEWNSYTGHYRSYNPWESNCRIMVRRDKLFLVWPDGFAEELTQVAENKFRIGALWSPEHLKFSDFSDRKALCVNLTNCEFYRFFTD